MLQLCFNPSDRMSLKEEVMQGLENGHCAPVDICDSPTQRRGVIATASIKAGSYICEYCTTAVYNYDDRHKQFREYDFIGEEKSYLIVREQGFSLVFDATRKYSQFGRYIKRSKKEHNYMWHHPFHVRGKQRIGIYATHNIAKGDELLLKEDVLIENLFANRQTLRKKRTTRHARAQFLNSVMRMVLLVYVVMAAWFVTKTSWSCNATMDFFQWQKFYGFSFFAQILH